MSEATKTEASAAAETPPAGPSKIQVLKGKLSGLLPKFSAKRKLGTLEKVFVGVVSGSMTLAIVALFFGVRLFLAEIKHASGLDHIESVAEGHGTSDGHEDVHVHTTHGGSGEALASGDESDPHHEGVETADHDEGEHESEDSGHGEHGEASVLTQEEIPKSIKDRQNGKRAEGQDLVDPEISESRGLASLGKDGLQVEGPPKYVEINEIVSGTRGLESGDAVVMGDIVLVMDNYEAQQEASGKDTEFKALVTSLIADHTREELRTFRGKAALKVDIQREINHLLSKGQVKDVLFSKFLVR